MINSSALSRRFLTAAVTVVTGSAFGLVALAPAALATAPSGTILYDKGGNVFQTTADKSTTWQVTHDGTTPTADGTGSTGYTVPTESSTGLIVAVRNQSENSGEYDQGYLWVMDRTGKVIRKFRPAQFNLVDGAPCSPPVYQLPLGILNATISPDGAHVAYTAQAYVQSATCSVVTGYSSWIVNSDGTGAHMLSAGSSTTADLEIGRWVSNTRLLVDRADFGSIENFYVDLPSYTATSWSAPAAGDYIDEAYLQPDVANGVVVTDGYSEYASNPVIRLWSTAGFGTAPVAKCEYQSIAHPNTTDVNLNQPSLSPDGVDVVFEDYQGDADAANEGVYIAPAAATLDGATGCTNSTQTLFVQGAEDPFWTTASITQLPPDTTAPTVTLTAPSAAALAASSVTVRWSGHDDYSGVASYAVRYKRAPYTATFPTTWSYPSSWQALTSTSLVVSVSAGYGYCFSVKAYDHAGNASAWSSYRCTAVAMDDRSLTHATSGWTSGTGSSYYKGTVTYTKTLGAKLTRTGGVSIKRVGIVVKTCSSCGTVAVYVGTTYLGKISLVSSTTHYMVIKLLSPFSARNGTVTVKSVTSGKLIAIDGLVISHT